MEAQAQAVLLATSLVYWAMMMVGAAAGARSGSGSGTHRGKAVAKRSWWRRTPTAASSTAITAAVLVLKLSAQSATLGSRTSKHDDTNLHA